MPDWSSRRQLRNSPPPYDGYPAIKYEMTTHDTSPPHLLDFAKLIPLNLDTVDTEFPTSIQLPDFLPGPFNDIVITHFGQQVPPAVDEKSMAVGCV